MNRLIVSLALLGTTALLAATGAGGVSLGRSGSPTSSGPGRWAPTGGPEGGGVLSLAVDPANPKIVYAGGWGNVFKSTDGGVRWRDASHEPWQHVSALAIDPAHPDTIYAGTDRGIGKSLDGGRHWRMVNTGLFTGDTFMRWGREHWLGLLLDPNRPQTVYVLGWSGVFRTTDGGAHWRFLRPRLGRYWFRTAAAIDPVHPGTVYASWARYGVGSNLYEATDGGDSWSQIAVKGHHPSFASLVIDPDAPGTILATDDSDPAIYRSTDGGTTWSIVTLPLATADGLQVLAGSRGMLYATTSSGTLFTSADAGATWQTVGSGAGLADGPLVADPQNPATLYYGVEDGIAKSRDGGHTWTTSHDGLVNTLITSLVFAPGSSTLYAGTYGGIFKTTNRGRVWQLEKSTAFGPSWAEVNTLAVSPQRPRVIYAVAQERGLFTSSDAGAHWSRVKTPFPSKGVQAIAIDPRQPHTVFVADCGGACSGGTLQETDDGGASWRPITGVPWAVQSLAIDPQHPSTVFAGTNRGDIYRSSDGGRRWDRVVMPPTLPQSHQYAIVAIAIDPRDTDNVYAGRRNGGIVKSTDGGQTWAKANAGLTDRRVNALAIDSHNLQVLFTSTQGGVFRSSNGGKSWQPYGRGISAGGVTAFAIDLAGRTIYAATNGDGVLSLKLDG